MRVRYLVVLGSLMLFLSGCYLPMSGRVIDAETNQPVEGAVVLVEWTKTIGYGLTYTESYKVAEALSDKEGRFYLPGCYSPIVNAPDVTIYKKAYVAWNSRNIFPDRRNRIDYKWGNETFKLEHFESDYSFDEHIMFLESAIHVNLGTLKKNSIINAFKWEREKASSERDLKPGGR